MKTMQQAIDLLDTIHTDLARSSISKPEYNSLSGKIIEAKQFLRTPKDTNTMKIDKKEIEQTIEQIIGDGVIHGEEVDITAKKVMDAIWPTIDYLNNHTPTIPEEIRDELDADMEDGCMPQGEIESCLIHWGNKYVIRRRDES